MKEIELRLRELSDSTYKDFHSRLMPTVEKEKILGVRIPLIRQLSKELIKEGKAEDFIKELPHYYYEENNLHAFIIAEIKDFERLSEETEKFLPFIDNWATCDSFRPKAFAKNKEKLLPLIFRWLESDEEYTVRYAIEMLMVHFLDDSFDEKYPAIISGIRSDKYYVNMMIAWYFATALAKQPERIKPFISREYLSEGVYNKTLQKIRESCRTKRQKQMQFKGRSYRKTTSKKL